jgi:hypothetical protein
MFQKFKTKIAAQRIIDEQLYAYVYDEMESGDIRRGIWAKATADAEGAQGKVEALYIKYRVQSIKDEANVLERILNEIDNNQIRNEVSIQSPLTDDEDDFIQEKKTAAKKVDAVKQYNSEPHVEYFLTSEEKEFARKAIAKADAKRAREEEHSMDMWDAINNTRSQSNLRSKSNNSIKAKSNINLNTTNKTHLTEEGQKLMVTHGITFADGFYHIGGSKYQTLNDAIEYGGFV